MLLVPTTDFCVLDRVQRRTVSQLVPVGNFRRGRGAQPSLALHFNVEHWTVSHY